jgi:lipopolysaccharide/colanic/teichoic acid biosynthesis glycosyltransferase
MNNSELSVAPSCVETLREPQTHVKNNSHGIPLHVNRHFQNGRHSEGMVGVECTEATSDNSQPWSKTKRPDLGLWLLHGSVIRHDQWERVLGTLQSASRAGDYSAKHFPGFVKRFCDVAVSLFLLVVLFPLFPLIAILIKLDSSGPVFFRHYRIGKDGQPFELWKFRSMRAEVPEYEASPRSAVDWRLTRMGRLIRRMSIDEIPQLINVLKGEMSLVGPRPEMPFIVARYHALGQERLAVRPGITGLWQISPARAFPIHENFQYDIHYIRNQNFLLDCAILARTIAAVIHGVGAV